VSRLAGDINQLLHGTQQCDMQQANAGSVTLSVYVVAEHRLVIILLFVCGVLILFCSIVVHCIDSMAHHLWHGYKECAKYMSFSRVQHVMLFRDKQRKSTKLTGVCVNYQQICVFIADTWQDRSYSADLH